MSIRDPFNLSATPRGAFQGSSKVWNSRYNHAPHSDAREALQLFSASQSRTGGRGCWAAQGAARG